MKPVIPTKGKKSDHKGLTPAKAKRRTPGWDPSPVKKFSIKSSGRKA